MSDETQDLDEMLGFLAEDGRQRRDPEEHPSPEELSAYQANELSPEEDERIQGHLAVCQHCTELLLDLEEFLKPPSTAAAESAADFEAAADWRRLREGMKPVGGKPESIRANAPEWRNDRLLRSLQMYRVLAAVLGFVVVGLTLYAVGPHDRPEILHPPVPMDFGTTRGSSDTEPLKVHLPFPFVYDAVSGYPKYRLEIVDSDGNLRYSSDTNLSQGYITLPRGLLSPSDYEVRLSGLKGERIEPIGRPQKIIVLP